MSKIILDSSALLALLNEEAGHEMVQKILPNAIMSTVNIAESIACLIKINVSKHQAQLIIQDLINEIIPYDFEQASLTAEIKIKAKSLGLSLADCACLALAKFLKVPVYTADKIWLKFNDNIKVHLIR
ncbi:MAG: type II toxin-antitoxin system VapC family toxin [Gammaproteobacteria bacterium]